MALFLHEIIGYWIVRFYYDSDFLRITGFFIMLVALFVAFHAGKRVNKH